GTSHHEGLEDLLRPLLPNPATRLGADEARVLLDAPAEPRLDRSPLLGGVVSKEAVVALEAEGVASAEARRRGPPVDDGVPDGDRVGARREQRDPVPDPV